LNEGPFGTIATDVEGATRTRPLGVGEIVAPLGGVMTASEGRVEVAMSTAASEAQRAPGLGGHRVPLGDRERRPQAHLPL